MGRGGQADSRAGSRERDVAFDLGPGVAHRVEDRDVEGKGLPDEQEWPECRVDRKIELLEEMKMQGGMQHEA